MGRVRNRGLGRFCLLVTSSRADTVISQLSLLTLLCTVLLFRTINRLYACSIKTYFPHSTLGCKWRRLA